MAYRDLREWIDSLEKEGELARVKTKVDWNLEIGGIAQKVFDKKGPALLFENIKDHEGTLCKKFFTGSLANYSRIALMMGLPKGTPPKEIIRTYMERLEKPIKPVRVKTGPVKKNIVGADNVDLFQFPAPKWRLHDGGRYIGTCDGVVTKDPETGWVNVGLYRRMILNKNQTGITIIPGQHNWMHWRKHRKLGKKTMPMAMINGWDPVLPMVSCLPTAPGVCEYDLMGGIRQEPVELVKCETIDLEVPATAQIIIEGEINLDFESFQIEGPFGEFQGYYGSLASKKPVVTWNCITCQDDPILQGTLEGMPINEDHHMESINLSALCWKTLNERMRGVLGVNVDPSTGWTNAFVQIDNSYIGQVHQVATGIWCNDWAFQVAKNIMVVDEDIDIFDLNKLAWAFATRVYPPRDIIQFPGSANVTDPAVHPKDRVGLKGQTTYMGVRLLIDATKFLGNPRHEDWGNERFAPVARIDEDTVNKVRTRWKEYGIEL
jgi:UbiD family decarboxylase